MSSLLSKYSRKFLCLFLALNIFSFTLFFSKPVHAVPVATATAFEIAKKILVGVALKKCVEMGAENFNKSDFGMTVSKSFGIDKNGLVTPIQWAANKFDFLDGLKKFCRESDGSVIDKLNATGQGYIYVNFGNGTIKGYLDGCLGITVKADGSVQMNYGHYTDIYSQTSNKAWGYEWGTGASYYSCDITGCSYATNVPYLIEQGVPNVNTVVEPVPEVDITTVLIFNPDEPELEEPGSKIGPDGAVTLDENNPLLYYLRKIISILQKILDKIVNFFVDLLKFIKNLFIVDNFTFSKYNNISFDFGFFTSFFNSFHELVKNTDDGAPSFSFVLPNFLHGDDWSGTVNFAKIFENIPNALKVVKTVNTSSIVIFTIFFIKRKMEEIEENL